MMKHDDGMSTVGPEIIAVHSYGITTIWILISQLADLIRSPTTRGGNVNGSFRISFGPLTDRRDPRVPL